MGKVLLLILLYKSGSWQHKTPQACEAGFQSGMIMVFIGPCDPFSTIYQENGINTKNRRLQSYLGTENAGTMSQLKCGLSLFYINGKWSRQGLNSGLSQHCRLQNESGPAARVRSGFGAENQLGARQRRNFGRKKLFWGLVIQLLGLFLYNINNCMNNDKMGRSENYERSSFWTSITMWVVCRYNRSIGHSRWMQNHQSRQRASQPSGINLYGNHQF
jgi:hypothetical protein